MSEDGLLFQVGGAVLVGGMLGIVARRRGWPPFWSVGAGVLGYVALLIAIAYVFPAETASGAAPRPPVSFGVLLLGCLYVAPGFCIYFALPLILTFVFAYMWTSARPADGT